MKKIILLFNDVKLTEFMQGVDVFEPGKIVLTDIVIARAQDDFGQANVERLVKANESRPEPYRLVAVVGDGIEWRDPEVKIVSTGTEWAPIENYIHNLRIRYELPNR